MRWRREVDGAEAARDVDDRVAERLPHGAAPAGVEGAHDLVARVGRRAPRRARRGWGSGCRRSRSIRSGMGLTFWPFGALRSASMARAARWPSSTALTTSLPPLTAVAAGEDTRVAGGEGLRIGDDATARRRTGRRESSRRAPGGAPVPWPRARRRSRPARADRPYRVLLRPAWRTTPTRCPSSAALERGDDGVVDEADARASAPPPTRGRNPASPLSLRR